jgi:hypothetical protein
VDGVFAAATFKLGIDPLFIGEAVNSNETGKQ